MQFDPFIHRLTQSLSQTLPGRSAHLKMASLKRFSNPEMFNPRPDARQSAVLILFYPEDDQVYTTVIKRPEYDGVHSGQIAFPGGRQEPSDPDITATALRETHEEIGVSPDQITILGQLSSLYIPPSNSLVFPVLGFTTSKPVMKAQKQEVASIICFPLSTLLLAETLTTKPVKAGNWSAEVPCYFVNEEVIWGATAMIISELLEIIRRDD